MKQNLKIIAISCLCCLIVGRIIEFVKSDTLRVQCWPFTRNQSEAVVFARDDARAGLFLSAPDGLVRSSLLMDGNSGDSSLQITDGGKNVGGMTLVVGLDGKATVGLWDRDGLGRLILIGRP